MAEENEYFTVWWASIGYEQVVMLHRVHKTFINQLCRFIEYEPRPGLVDETQAGQIIEYTCTYLDAIRAIKSDYSEFAQRNGWSLYDLDTEFRSLNRQYDGNFKGAVLHLVGEIAESITEAFKPYGGADPMLHRRVFATHVRDLYIIDNFGHTFDVITADSLRRGLGLIE